MQKISVFGSAVVAHDSVDYRASVAVGQALAEAGYTVMTGGYGGVMEAISRGASEAGGHVIGVTTSQIESIRPLGANAWVKEEIKYPLLRDRLFHMVREADGYLAMPGGVGTLHEVVETWELMRIGGIPARPLICYGEHWQRVFTDLMDSPYVNSTYHSLIAFAHTPDDVVAQFQTWQVPEK